MSTDSITPPTSTSLGPATDAPIVVLVHGAWHGAWCWVSLQAALERRGVASLAIDLPGHGTSTDQLTGLHGDAAHVRRVLDLLAARSTRPIVLVGHSYGGAVITQAAAGRDDIAHLLYVAAFALDAGESVLGALGSFEPHEVDLAAAMIPTDDGTATVLDHATAAGALYNECPPEAVAAALPRLTPQPIQTLTEPVDGSPRHKVESTYVWCGRDRAIHPVHQAAMAQRCTHRIDLDTDHSPFVSAVGDMADIVAHITDHIAASVAT